MPRHPFAAIRNGPFQDFCVRFPTRPVSAQGRVLALNCTRPRAAVLPSPEMARSRLEGLNRAQPAIAPGPPKRPLNYKRRAGSGRSCEARRALRLRWPQGQRIERMTGAAAKRVAQSNLSCCLIEASSGTAASGLNNVGNDAAGMKVTTPQSGFPCTHIVPVRIGNHLDVPYSYLMNHLLP